MVISRKYKAYLKSQSWYTKRQEFKSSDLFFGHCSQCGNEEDIVIHHKTYKNIFNENLEDLTALCRDCHDEIHGKHKKKKKKKKRKKRGYWEKLKKQAKKMDKKRNKKPFKPSSVLRKKEAK